MKLTLEKHEVRVEPGAQPGDLLKRSIGMRDEYYRVVGKDLVVKVSTRRAEWELFEAAFFERLGWLCLELYWNPPLIPGAFCELEQI